MPIDLSQFQNCTTAACSTEMVTAFHLNQPVWDSAVVFDEPVLVDGKPIKLWRQPDAILVVSNRQTNQAFTRETDFHTQDGDLIIPEGSKIATYRNYQFAKLPNVPEIFQSVTKDGQPLRIDQTYQRHQIAVTYMAGVLGKKPKKIGSVPASAERVSLRKPQFVTFYGDSITDGSNATGTTNEAPFQPGWVDLVGAMLSNDGDGKFYWRNKSVGGWSSQNGIDNVEAKINTSASDLVVLAYGMNDATGNVPPEKFEFFLRMMIKSIREKNPKTEFILVSSFLGNPDWKPMNTSLLFDYRKAMIRITKNTKNVALADMTTLSKDILSKKNYYDITSNGVNHPGDWMHVAYAQVVADVIRGR